MTSCCSANSHQPPPSPSCSLVLVPFYSPVTPFSFFFPSLFTEKFQYLTCAASLAIDLGVSRLVLIASCSITATLAVPTFPSAAATSSLASLHRIQGALTDS